ncbi:hypothetical protein SAMN06266787_11826 [Halorubrum ezzemoulense]|uniref:Uncharacterized protein n=2 Tax=Halorubrum ezzemoulense TaxID=337243 RepID=A0A238YU96_HALEZ|nr:MULTISPECIES: hypothetical protein [unclassified Halorubrum]SNR74214.1 hypothetical protein SAMN06266787_11826 [Halorubrum ezzemoulense]
MLFSDALDMEFDKVEIPKQDDCPVCGDDSAIESVHDVGYRHPARLTLVATPNRRSKRSSKRLPSDPVWGDANRGVSETRMVRSAGLAVSR